jgi:hypothetical protein
LSTFCRVSIASFFLRVVVVHASFVALLRVLPLSLKEMKVVNVLQVSALVSSSDDIKIRDGVTKNDDDDDDAFWRPKDERFPERNAT